MLYFAPYIFYKRMNVFRTIIVVILLLLSVAILAQNSGVKIKGVVMDLTLNEAIPNVNIILDGSTKGTISDYDGKFELLVEKDEYVKLIFFHTSFEIDTVLINFSKNKFVKVYLKEKQYLKNEITVKANQNSLVKGNIPGKILIKQKEVLATPTLMGEPDLIRTLQLLPGIQSVNEGNSGIYVRGGSPGQNYVVFDGIELMNPSHLMGIYSVFNPFLVDNVSFYKGNAPMRYSSRLASSIIVNSIDQKQGNYNWALNIGNINSNVSYQGNSANKKWFTTIGFRRSYIEGIQSVANLFIEDQENYFTSNKFNFYDFNGKVKYKGDNFSLKMSWYKGGDYFNYKKVDNQIYIDNSWGNEGISLQFKSMFNSNILMQSNFSYSGYSSDLNLGIADQDLSFTTDYKQIKLNTEFLYEINGNSIRFGASALRRNIMPQNLDVSLNTNNDKLNSEYIHRIFELYLSDEFKLLPRLEMYIGCSAQLYEQVKKNASGFSNDTDYSSDKNRLLGKGMITLNYELSDYASLKASCNYLTQNIHLTSIASIPLPSDVWMPATDKVPAENSTQVTLGYFKSNFSNELEYGIEGYGRIQHNQLVLNLNMKGEEIDDFEDSFFIGESVAYGSEFFIKYNSENFNTNLSYTLGWVKQRFDALNNGKWHDAKYDRRHDINFLCSYKINNRIDVGGVFILATGNKATLPVGRYWMMGNIANDYDGINNYRMPLYHRMDLSINYSFRTKKIKESILNFSIINVLNRSNPYFIYYDVEDGVENYELSVKAKQVSLFPILPSLSWKVKF